MDGYNTCGRDVTIFTTIVDVITIADVTTLISVDTTTRPSIYYLDNLIKVSLSGKVLKYNLKHINTHYIQSWYIF